MISGVMNATFSIPKHDQLFDPFWKSDQPWVRTYFDGQFERVLQDVVSVCRLPDVRHVLNVGGSPFLFELLLREALPDAKISSLDLAPERFGELTRSLNVEVAKLDVETCSSEELSAVAGSPDVIVFSEVLEHMRVDLLGTLSRLYEALPVGGQLYLTTPNGLALRGIQRLFWGRTGPDVLHEWTKLSDIGHMGHVREYSMREVTDMLQHVGFEVVNRRYRRHWGSFWRGPPQMQWSMEDGQKSSLHRRNSRWPGLKYRLFTGLEWFLPMFRWNLVILARKV